MESKSDSASDAGVSSIKMNKFILADRGKGQGGREGRDRSHRASGDIITINGVVKNTELDYKEINVLEKKVRKVVSPALHNISHQPP